GMVCVVGRMRDLILQLSKSSIYSTKPRYAEIIHNANVITIVKKRMASETSGSLSLASVVQWSE
ncbi:hypothetical protein SBU70_07905, partial [Klebsiella pneumoniae]|nr:hypothetical protein [Klebsiella pneumoniae]